MAEEPAQRRRRGQPLRRKRRNQHCPRGVGRFSVCDAGGRVYTAAGVQTSHTEKRDGGNARNKRMHQNHKLTVTDGIVILLFVIAATWFCAGFYYPDPYAFHRFGEGLVLLLVWAARIATPLVSGGILFIYIMVRTGRLSSTKALLMAGSTLASLLLLYPVGSFIYSRNNNIEQKIKYYHPYLQLTPPLPKQASADSSAIHIFCLGGSTTEYADKKGGGWVGRTEKLLRERTGRTDVIVHNLGRQWFTSLHTLINYETNLRHYKPRLIIVMHAINDLLQNADHSYLSHGPFREDYGHFYGPVTRLILNKGFLREVFGSMRLWYSTPRETIETHEFPGLVSFERNLSTLLDLAQKDGTRVVLMTQPTLLKDAMSPQEQKVLHMVAVEAYGPKKKWSYATASRGMKAYNSCTKNVAKTRGVALIDLAQAVPQTLDYFWDDVHYNETTYTFISEFVVGELLRQNVLDPLLKNTPADKHSRSP
ncbi:MAG: SGNH/GDSL hydrolase family protein [Verrucomicrobia bacterium]|nr:SGNH/GDSL hydrolase family protein [Verrucomicrobiota bacterium]